MTRLPIVCWRSVPNIPPVEVHTAEPEDLIRFLRVAVARPSGSERLKTQKHDPAMVSLGFG